MTNNSSELDSIVPSNKIFAPDNAQIISFLISIQFLGFFFYGGYRVIFPIILKNIGYSEAEITTSWAIVFTIALFLGGFLTRIPMGVLSDSVSRKKGLLFGTSLSIISILLMDFTTNLIVLGLLFALLRTGTHIFPLTTRSYSNSTDPLKQRRLNGFVLVGTDVASFFGPIILGFFLEISLQALIAFSCITLLITFLVLNFTTPKKIKRVRLPVKKIFIQAGHELTSIWKLIAVFIIIGLINGIFGTVLVPFATTTIRLSDTTTELYVGLIMFTAIVFILFSGELKNRFGIFYLIITGVVFIFTGASIIFIGGKNILTFLIGSMLINGGIQININSLVTAVTLTASKETAATCFGMASGFFFLGASLIPLIISVVSHINPFYPFLVIIFVSLIVIYPVIHIKGEYQHKQVFKNL